MQNKIEENEDQNHKNGGRYAEPPIKRRNSIGNLLKKAQDLY